MLTHRTTTIDRTTVHYWERNPDAKRTIIFIHGFKGNHKGLTDFSHYFKDFRTILIDLPGYGLSQKLPHKHTIKNYAQFIEAFAQHLNLTSFDLIGHSYGGSISIVYAGMHPGRINHLILISPGIPFESLSQSLAQIQLSVGRIIPRSLSKAWLASPLLEVLAIYTLVKTASKKRKRKLLLHNLRNAKEQRPEVITECLNSFLSTPFYSYAQKISSPTLILAGDNDFIAPLDTLVTLSQKINLSRVQLMDNIGHLAPLERPIAVGRLVESFMEHTANQPTHLHRASSTQFVTHPKNHKRITVAAN